MKDALRVKRIKVVPMIVETAGGVTPQFVAQVGRLSRRAASKSGRDSTKYGTSRTSTTGFFHHHIERIGASLPPSVRPPSERPRARSDVLSIYSSISEGVTFPIRFGDISYLA